MQVSFNKFLCNLLNLFFCMLKYWSVCLSVFLSVCLFISVFHFSHFNERKYAVWAFAVWIQKLALEQYIAPLSILHKKIFKLILFHLNEIIFWFHVIIKQVNGISFCTCWTFNFLMFLFIHNLLNLFMRTLL